MKVVLAAAMWLNPHILVLDEPTNYLDRDSLGALATAIREYGGGVVMISHNSGAPCEGPPMCPWQPPLLFMLEGVSRPKRWGCFVAEEGLVEGTVEACVPSCQVVFFGKGRGGWGSPTLNPTLTLGDGRAV